MIIRKIVEGRDVFATLPTDSLTDQILPGVVKLLERQAKIEKGRDSPAQAPTFVTFVHFSAFRAFVAFD